MVQKDNSDPILTDEECEQLEYERDEIIMMSMFLRLETGMVEMGMARMGMARITIMIRYDR